MAELSYDDVRRAAREAAKELQGLLGNLKSNSDETRRAVQHLAGHIHLGELYNKINTLQAQLNTVDTMLRYQSSALQASQQGIADLQRRLVAMEEFVQFTYRYVTTQQQAAQPQRPRRQDG